MADRPYSRLYHELADEYPDLYDSPDLAGYVRLLVAADQSWPTSARWAGYVSKAEVQRIAGTGLVILDGARYRIKGMDKEREARSESASHAARTRWSDAPSNAPRNADRSTARNAETMPRRAETSKDEPSNGAAGIADPVETYHMLTGRPPKKATIAWLDELAADHDPDRVSRVMAAVWTAKADLGSFIGDVQAELVLDARKEAKAADERRRQSELEYQRTLEDGMPPEQRAANMARLKDMLHESGVLP